MKNAAKWLTISKSPLTALPWRAKGLIFYWIPLAKTTYLNPALNRELWGITGLCGEPYDQ